MFINLSLNLLLMPKTTISGIVNTSIITAFTIAAALIWKDVIMAVIEVFVPPNQKLLYQFLAALIATLLVVIAIILILKTEQEVEVLEKRFGKKR